MAVVVEWNQMWNTEDQNQQYQTLKRSRWHNET